MPTKTLVVILNYRTASLTVACLRSLADQVADLPGVQVVVVDNASGDGSAEQIALAIHAQGWDSWASLLPLPRNDGYAAGNNAAIRPARQSAQAPSYVMILNPDTVVHPGALAAIVAFMDAHPSVGLAGCGLEDGQGRQQASGFRFPTPWSELDGQLRHYQTPQSQRSQPRECEWVSGSAMVIRSAVFDSVGLMDEGYFLYFDEVDFCARSRLAGWPVWVVPEARVTHLEGQATAIHRNDKRRASYWYDSRRRFFVKMHGVIGLLLADLLWSVGWLRNLLKNIWMPASSRSPKWFAWDLLWGDLWALVTGRVFRIRRERTQT